MHWKRVILITITELNYWSLFSFSIEITSKSPWRVISWFEFMQSFLKSLYICKYSLVWLREEGSIIKKGKLRLLGFFCSLFLLISFWRSSSFFFIHSKMCYFSERANCLFLIWLYKLLVFILLLLIMIFWFCSFFRTLFPSFIRIPAEINTFKASYTLLLMFCSSLAMSYWLFILTLSYFIESFSIISATSL